MSLSARLLWKTTTVAELILIEFLIGKLKKKCKVFQCKSNYITNQLTNQLTYSMLQIVSWKIISPRLVKKFTALYGTQSFTTLLITARQLSLSWNIPVQSMPSKPNSLGFSIILSFHSRLVLPSGLFLQVSLPKLNILLCVLPQEPHAPRTSLLLDFIAPVIIC